MSAGVVTFDFHDTLIRCDAWFELEVRTLVGAYLQWISERSGNVVAPSLIDAANAQYQSLRSNIIKHGHELPAERCVELVLRQLDVPTSQDNIAEGIHELMLSTLDTANAIPGGMETLVALQSANIQMAVVSSAVYHPFLDWALGRFGLSSLFQIIVTSASSGYYKSRPEIFWTAASALERSPALSVHVGDSLRYDVGGAHRAGMKTAWLSHGRAATLNDIAPDIVVSTLEGSSERLLALLSQA